MIKVHEDRRRGSKGGEGVQEGEGVQVGIEVREGEEEKKWGQNEGSNLLEEEKCVEVD